MDDLLNLLHYVLNCNKVINSCAVCIVDALTKKKSMLVCGLVCVGTIYSKVNH